MADKLTVYLHIGAAKVGSSSMQYWMLRSEKDLNQRGILMLDQDMRPHTPVEQDWIWNQSHTFHQLYPDVPDRVEKFTRIMNDISIYMRQNGFHSVIISSVILTTWAVDGRFHELFAPLVDQYNWRIIFYVRNQHAYLTSAWKHWYYADSRYANIDDWLSQMLGKEGNWLQAIEPWAALFPREHITVRVLDRRFLRNGSLWDDFADVLGVPNTRTDERIQNESFNNHAVTTLNAMVRYEGLRDYETWFIKQMLEERAPDLGFGKDTDASIIGPEWHDRIRETYAESNQQLVMQYIGDSKALECFDLPPAKPKFTMTNQQIVLYGLRILMAIIFHIDQENRSFRQKIGNLHHQHVALTNKHKKLAQQVAQITPHMHEES